MYIRSTMLLLSCTLLLYEYNIIIITVHTHTHILWCAVASHRLSIIPYIYIYCPKPYSTTTYTQCSSYLLCIRHTSHYNNICRRTTLYTPHIYGTVVQCTHYVLYIVIIHINDDVVFGHRTRTEKFETEVGRLLTDVLYYKDAFEWPTQPFRNNKKDRLGAHLQRSHPKRLCMTYVL